MATCKDCDNYKKCKKYQKLKIEVYSNGWLAKPRLCSYVEQICSSYLPKLKQVNLKEGVEE